MGPVIFVLIACFLATTGSEVEIDGYMKFPAGFIFGVSTSAYQIEGAWNVSDKGVNIWDRFTHEVPSPVADGSNGDVACDSYHKYKEDLGLLKNLGVDSYRLSLSWSRILPTGFADKVSRDGIRYYRNLLDDLRAQGVEPFVTIYHWDHPAILEDMGGWTNEMMVTWFVDYARVVFNELGDRVKLFLTINELADNCKQAYGSGEKAPGKSLPGIGPYLCMHNKLKAHAEVYRMYDEEYRPRQKGQIGVSLQCMSYYPKYANDTESADVYFDFHCGWMMNPIFSSSGDYPAVMKRRIAENSRLEGYPRSRLPEFSQAEIDRVRGTADFIGLNHYTSRLTEPAPKSDDALWYEDSGVIKSCNESWPSTNCPWLKIVPQGLGDLLRRLTARYGRRAIYVLENGMADDGSSLEDHQRVSYLHDHLWELLLAVNRDNCDVRGYFVWSFLDNFEWQDGYGQHFGLVSVDFDHPNRTRTPKRSYAWYKQIIDSRTLRPRIPRQFSPASKLLD